MITICPNDGSRLEPRTILSEDNPAIIIQRCPKCFFIYEVPREVVNELYIGVLCDPNTGGEAFLMVGADESKPLVSSDCDFVVSCFKRLIDRSTKYDNLTFKVVKFTRSEVIETFQ